MLSTTSRSKITRRREQDEAPVLPDIILPDDPRGDLGEPSEVVAEVEARTFGQGSTSDHCKRARANDLHREADELYYKGDYESALVLYHRAARLWPRDTLHSVAARRTESAISSAANPTRGLGRLLREVRTPGQMSAVLCPEAAARRAQRIVAESDDPVQDIPRILRYFDARRDFWRLPSPGASPRPTRSKMMLRQLNNCVKSTFKDLEFAYQSGDSQQVHKLSDQLVNLVSITEDPNRNQVDTCGYLANKQITLGRHDRALDLAAKMIFLARTSGDPVSMVKALITVGRVHLKFGHLDALVKVWERLVGDLQTEAIAQAWLYHDIGRCHLELGDMTRALDSARLCLGRAASSKKWMLRGQLLSGQSLLKLGRFSEAVAALKNAAKIAEQVDEDASNRSILLYVQSLIDQVTCLLRRLNRERDRRVELLNSSRTSNSISGTDLLRKEDDAKVELMQLENLEKPSTATEERGREMQSEDESDDDRIALLLERARSLRRIHSPKRDRSVDMAMSRLLSGDSSDDEAEDEGGKRLELDSSRTRIIRRAEADSDEEKTLREERLLSLVDLDGGDQDGNEDDFASARVEDETASDNEAEAAIGASAAEENLAKKNDVAEEETNNEDRPVSYFSPDDGLTSQSFSYSLDSESEPQDMALDNPSQREPAKSLTSYLRSLNIQDFEELQMQERSFFEARSSSGSQ